MTISQKAYRQWVSERGSEEDILPGLGVTHNQLFFIGYAQTWCGSRTKQSMIHKINSNEHSPYRFRLDRNLHSNDMYSYLNHLILLSP